MSETVTVLQSFQIPRATTNPYLVMLGECLRVAPHAVVLNFSWRTAILGRYDVFHVHWPEILVDGHSPLKKLVRQALTLVLLAKLRFSRTPIVRTMHNVGLPEGISRREIWLLRLLDRQTTMRIRLNTTTAIPPGQPHVTIPHGHYRDWFAPYRRNERIPGRIGYFGLIRRYKGVEGLIQAFRGTRDHDPELTLDVRGNPSTDELAEAITRLSRDDARIVLDLKFLSDAELVEVVTASELVVLPYRFMHNSGGTLAALSLDRPVLVPDNAVNRNLSEEVGTGWVFRFGGELTSGQIVDTIAALRNQPQHRGPDLSGRNWDRVGTDHLEAYRNAIALLQRRPRRSLAAGATRGDRWNT